MLDALRKNSPVLVDEVLKSTKNTGISNISEIHKILQGLLKEKVKIRNMIPILETIADYKSVMHIDALGEKIREVLCKQIVANPAISHNHTIKALVVDHNWEQILIESIKENNQGYISTLSYELTKEFVHSTGTALEQKFREGIQPVVLCSRGVRLLVRNILVNSSFSDTTVLAHSEVPNDYIVETLGYIAKS